MALTSAVAANAAAVAAGAGKKAALVQLQAELNTDEDWDKFLKRDGLLVIDVYSEWCGPCIGMVGNLKKIKVELGGDNLHLAVAKADTIECLKRFRNRSEPTWMFIAGGQLINVVFGADAPRLARTIEAELKNEELVRKGELTRERRLPHELTPQEQEAANAQLKQAEEKEARELAAAAAARSARRDARAALVDAHFADICPALLTPHAQKHVRKIADALEPFGVVVADKCPLLMDVNGGRVLGAEDPEFRPASVIAALVERPCLALMLKKLSDKEGCVVDLVHRAIFGDDEEVEPDKKKKTVADELRMESIPGIFAPADRQQRAVAMDLLFPKLVGSVLPPPPPLTPPHVAMVFGAWQRRAVLAAAAALSNRMLKYGFFADANVEEPKLLVKTIEKYEDRPEKNFNETIVLMVSVGVAEPLLHDPSLPVPRGPPADLLALGPLHVSADAVAGEAECARFFPPNYTEPEVRPKPKSKKKKKKRQEQESKEEVADASAAPSEAPAEAAAEAEGEAEADGGEHEAEDDDGEDAVEGEGEDRADKATSPPPQGH